MVESWSQWKKSSVYGVSGNTQSTKCGIEYMMTAQSTNAACDWCPDIAAQVVETWSQWAGSGLLRHTKLRQQALQALHLLADKLHAASPSLVRTL